jgi:broad specificity phosphatase PhoE
MSVIVLLNYGETVPHSAEVSLADAEHLPLSDHGRAQMTACVASLAGQNLTTLYHSGSLVAQYTADMLSRQCISLKKLYTFFILGDVWKTDDTPPMVRVTHVKPPAVLAAQLESAWDALLARHISESAVIIVHPEISRLLLGLTLGLPPERWEAIRQDPGAINRLTVEPHRTVVTSINDVCHLFPPDQHCHCRQTA